METMEQPIIKGYQIQEFWQMEQLATSVQPVMDQSIEVDQTARTLQELTMLSLELLEILIILWEGLKSKPKITQEQANENQLTTRDKKVAQIHSIIGRYLYNCLLSLSFRLLTNYLFKQC